MEIKPKILVVVGPTASGKTSLSIDLAKKFDGEIISADSRQVYRGLDLGTGKVTKEETGGIPHHLLDVADPKDIYTVNEFVKEGRNIISGIIKSGKLPVIVGGTFFYIDALLGKIETPEVPPNRKLREQLEGMNADSLYTVLLQNDPRRAADIDPHNKRRLVRALEIVEAIGLVPKEKSDPLYNSLTIGISIPKDALHKNIHTRLLTRIDEGMIEEVEALQKNGLSYERMDELGLEYRYISRHLQNLLTKEEMLAELETKIKQFAKRQMTWLKRDKTIQWFDLNEKEKIYPIVENFIES